mgnify:CR=1 FL=1
MRDNGTLTVTKMLFASNVQSPSAAHGLNALSGNRGGFPRMPHTDRLCMRPMHRQHTAIDTRNPSAYTNPMPVAKLALLILALSCNLRAADFDVVVYGGTSAGVIAAIQAKRMGKSTVIVCPDKHLGGLSSGGISWTDTGNKAVIGGLAREFYHRVWKHYDQPSAWRWQAREAYGNQGQGTPAIDGAQRTMWIFEPHVAEQVFEDLVRESQVPVQRDEWLDRARGVKRDGARLTTIVMLSGKTYAGKMFIDATYEGDLMIPTMCNATSRQTVRCRTKATSASG